MYYTDKLGLQVPEQDDIYDIGYMENNADVLEKTIGDVDVKNKGNLQEQIDNKIGKDGDTADNTVKFESIDTDEPEAWTETDVITTGEKHASLFNKISTMFANLRYIYNNVGKIKGIIETLDDCVATTEDGYAASAKALSQLNSKLKVKIVLASTTISIDGLSGATVTLNLNVADGYKAVIITQIGISGSYAIAINNFLLTSNNKMQCTLYNIFSTQCSLIVYAYVLCINKNYIN
jgi:hypothetical protein